VSVQPQSVLIDGVPAASLPATDRGLQYGDGLFETIAVLAGRARLWPWHLRRLGEGCARLGLAAPEASQLAAEVAALTAGEARAVVKLIVTRGDARARGYGVSGSERTRRVLLRYPWAQPGAGARVRLARLRLGENPALAGLKHLNRLEQVLARREHTGSEYDESLLFSSSGALISGTMTNVFLVRAGRLVTPRLDRCGVAGVMRAALMAMAHADGTDIEQGLLTEADLESCEEMFLTNALTGIRPVTELAGRALPAGPLTQRLQRSLSEVLDGRRELQHG